MSLSELLDRATFSVTSPGRVLRLDATMRAVNLVLLADPAAIASRDLERELAAVLHSWILTRDRVFRQATARAREAAGLPEPPPDRGTSRMADAVSRLEAEGRSRHGWATVRWTGHDSFDVTIDAVRMRRAKGGELRHELLSAVYSAISDQREQYALLRRRTLGRVFAVRDELRGDRR
ncbi:hypothetical protein Afil01_18280 [Actinorhabdospora filicis]|uniref:Uncharacterized protein n=1 Tax=Actinorhabdospora filicis TaxID=1785913 RepID=A0A9W6SLZ0_9ACTN|nr:hypothetical protein [Actinorhabdospora filicis]GLZ77021.1 hypothetical protein Afil01_18280 [Actinorhabdospora filicis]